MNRDLRSNVTMSQSIVPQASTTTVTGSSVDTNGYDSAFAEINFGAVTDGTWTPSLNHSVDGTTFTDAGTDGFLQNTFSQATSGAGGSAIQRIGYTGSKRYLQVVMTKSGSTTTGALFAANIALGHPQLAPLA